MCTSNKTRYILTPYLVVVWATSAIYDKKTGPMEADDNIIGASIEQVNDYVLAIIIIAVLTFVIRTSICCKCMFFICCESDEDIEKK